jgi:allantoin racemase
MEIRVIVPIIGESWVESARQTYAAHARPGTRISAVAVQKGPASIESRRDEALAVPEVMRLAQEAEREGVQAVIIDCMGDPGLEPAREVVSIPVIGPALACMHLAATLAHRFSIITLPASSIPVVEEQVWRYGLQHRLASVQAIEVAVLDIERHRNEVLHQLTTATAQAVLEDGAGAVIPGCTGMAGMAPHVQAALAERGCEVPVLDPPAVAVKLAESLVEMRLSHSRRTYPEPPVKEIAGY